MRLLASSAIVLLVGALGCSTRPAVGPAPQGAAAPQAKPPQNPVAPVVSETPAPEIKEQGSPVGDKAKPVADPLALPDRSSPAAVVRALAAALDAKDLASLARLRSGTGVKAALDERDTARAKIDFFGSNRESHWRRVLKAIDPDKLATLVKKDETKVSLAVPLGGARGDVQLVFERSGTVWLLVL